MAPSALPMSARPALLLALALVALTFAPVAGGTGVSVMGAGASMSTEKGMVAVATDDGVVGTAYDFDDSDGRTYWIVKACYELDAPAGVGACVREDVYWVVLLLA